MFSTVAAEVHSLATGLKYTLCLNSSYTMLYNMALTLYQYLNPQQYK